MRKILLIGAGLSSSSLIRYLLEQSAINNWQLTVGDLSLELAQKKIGDYPNGKAICFDVNNAEQRKSEIKKADIVISMLPKHFHSIVALNCIEFKKNLVTPSYVSDDIKMLDRKARQAGVLLMNEIGVDPGLDHLSAMYNIDKIKEKGGELISFKSFTGGLIAPEFDNNPWRYKFTWNPRNVVMAGRGVAKFIENGQYKYIPYHQLFGRTEILSILNYGEFEGYANRDSVKYREIYGLHNIPTIYRGTLRRPEFCKAWNIFVQLGLTDDSYIIEDSETMTYQQFINSFLPDRSLESVKIKLCQYLDVAENSDEIEKLSWLDLFDDKKIGLKNATPAQILLHLLEQKWKLDPGDRDMIVMHHIFDYRLKNKNYQLTSSLVVIGEEQPYTAMANTVGLPVGIIVKLIINSKIKLTGVQIPTAKEVYEPALKDLEKFGICFVDEEK